MKSVDKRAFEQVDPGYAREINDHIYVRCKNCNAKTKLTPDQLPISKWKHAIRDEITKRTGFIEYPSEDYEEDDWERNWYCSSECASLSEIAK